MLIFFHPHLVESAPTLASPLTYLQVPAGRWTCPHHFCCVCERKSQDCSNCLFRCPANIYFHAPAARSLRFCRIWEPSNFFRRCEMCPCAFCEDCKPDDMSFLPINDCRFTKRVLVQRRPSPFNRCFWSSGCKHVAKDLHRALKYRPTRITFTAATSVAPPRHS